tara:strand:- start:381 stop:935 length:555 start_codon:yes stop_codon:yes gene_type:complete
MAAPTADCLSIAEASLSDIEQVLDLTMYVFFGELGSDYGFNNNRATAFFQLQEEQSASLRDILSDAASVSYKASVDDEVVGFVTCSGDGVLTNLAVHPKARRRRVGRQLVEALLAGVSDDATVTLEVDGDNTPAFALYTAAGFVVMEDDKSGTRYTVDWWRGRVLEEVFKTVMRYEPGAGDGDV